MIGDVPSSVFSSSSIFSKPPSALQSRPHHRLLTVLDFSFLPLHPLLLPPWFPIFWPHIPNKRKNKTKNQDPNAEGRNTTNRRITPDVLCHSRSLPHCIVHLISEDARRLRFFAELACAAGEHQFRRKTVFFGIQHV